MITNFFPDIVPFIR